MAPATAGAAGSITEFSTGAGSSPSRITAGPDGNLWFTNRAGAIGKITPAGMITEYTAGLNPGSSPSRITVGPDGNLWFTDPSESTPAIGRITPTGTITEFSSAVNGEGEPAALSELGDIVAGPDGNLWFTDRALFVSGPPGIGRITPSGTISKFELNSWNQPTRIISGPDGNLWYTDPNGAPHLQAVGKVTPTGTITEYITPDKAPTDIVSGPDGNLWVTGAGLIRRITPSGTITEFSTGLNPGSQLLNITAGPDGNLWFTDSGSTRAIGRITPSGTISEFSSGLSPSLPLFPRNISSGTDGNLWFQAEPATIGRITPTGTITQFSIGLSKESVIGNMVAGPSNTDLWFTDTKAIGRIAPVGPVGISPQPTLAVDLTGTGFGSVSSSPGGIDCGSTCAAFFGEGETITLTPSPAAGSTFAGWSGGGCSGTGNCQITLNADTEVTATFVAGSEEPTPPPGTDGGVQPIPPEPVAPVLGTAYFASVAQVKGGKALIRTRCVGNTACRGIAKLIVPAKDKRVAKRRSDRHLASQTKGLVIGKGRFNVAAGKTGVLRIPLTRAGQKLVSQSGRRGLRATLVGTGLRNRAVALKVRSKPRQGNS